MQTTATRTPLLSGADAERALAIAERIFANARPLLSKTSAPESIGSFGGAVIVADALARAGCGGEDQVRALLREALVFAPDRLGLYHGAAGLLVALDVVDPARASLAAVRARLRDALAGSLADPPPIDFSEVTSYDLVSGVAGRAIALRGDVPAALPALRAYAERFADAVDAKLAAYDVLAPLNLGLSHGIPGILAALNLALPEERAPARRYVDLLLRMGQRIEGAYRWDAVWHPAEPPSARRAWCYQTVGVAAVLYDRARLDGDDELRALAADALAAVLDERHDAEQSWDAALCHGRSGVAAIAWHFADDERLVRHAAALARRVLAEYDPERALGYRTLNLRERRAEDRADFLDAALGIAQFLVDAATAQERRWLPLFGLLPD
jgi:hypothetical protein